MIGAKRSERKCMTGFAAKGCGAAEGEKLRHFTNEETTRVGSGGNRVVPPKPYVEKQSTNPQIERLFKIAQFWVFAWVDSFGVPKDHF
jgi:hypothetical protein